MWARTRHLWGELAVWLGLAGAAWLLTYQFDRPVQGYRFGATGWPRTILVLIALVALAQLVLGLRAAITDPRPPPTRPGPWERLRIYGLGRALRVGLTFALPITYVALLPGTGFYLTTPFFLLAYLYLLGERRPGRLLAGTFVVYALMVVLFTTVFYVALPVGNWPGFYDVNNWLLVRYR
jgi:hypothetical protein